MSTDSEPNPISPADPEVRHLVHVLARQATRRMSLPSSAADDISQAALMKLASLPISLRTEIKSPKAYLVKIVANEANTFFRQWDVGPTEPLKADRNIPTVDASGAEAGILLQEIWKHLNDEERQLLHLMIFGYSEKEMALRLKINYDSARKRVSRLRQKIQVFVG